MRGLNISSPEYSGIEEYSSLLGCWKVIFRIALYREYFLRTANFVGVESSFLMLIRGVLRHGIECNYGRLSVVFHSLVSYEARPFCDFVMFCNVTLSILH